MKSCIPDLCKALTSGGHSCTNVRFCSGLMSTRADELIDRHSSHVLDETKLSISGFWPVGGM